MQHAAPAKTSALTGAAHTRLDGKLENAMTGAGIRGVDASSSTVRVTLPYTPAHGRHEYRGSFAARREIDMPAANLVAGGFTLEDLPPGFDGPAIVSWMSDLGRQALPEDRGALAALSRLHSTGNICGGAAAVIVVDDDLETWEPLDLARVRDVLSIEILERDEITPWRDGLGGPTEYYVIGTSRTRITASSIVHASRVILHVGMRLGSARDEHLNLGWGTSALELLHTERQAMHLAHQEFGTLVLRATYDVVFLAELAERLCSETTAGRAEGDIDRQLALASRARGVHKMMCFDGGREGLGEDEPGRPSDRVESIGRPLDGVSKLGIVIADHWAGASGLTPSVALGRNFGGLNTGANAGDWQTVSNKTDGERSLWLMPRLDRLIEISCAAKLGPTGGRIPDTWRAEMKPLYVPSDTERATVRKLQAEADALYQPLSGITVDEMREQRQVLGTTGELRLEPLPVRAQPATVDVDVELELDEPEPVETMDAARVGRLARLMAWLRG